MKNLVSNLVDLEKKLWTEFHKVRPYIPGPYILSFWATMETGEALEEVIINDVDRAFKNLR